jgi:Ca2+-binding RTX toxin-like protein
MLNAIVSSGNNATEGGVNGTFIINLAIPAPAGGLIVNFTTTGSTATAATDYNFSAGSNIVAVTANTFTIAVGATTATLNVVAVADSILDANEKVILNLTDTLNYSTANTLNTGVRPRSSVTGDFNGDGKSDLAISNSDSGSVSVFLSSLNGSFNTPLTYVVGQQPVSIAVGDLNNDGISDLVTANFFTNKVSILFGNGNGVFVSTSNVIVGPSPADVAIGDFNGDGISDLALVNAGVRASVLLGDRINGGFLPSIQTFALGGFNASSVAIGDFNGDGKSDLVTANYVSDNASILYGDGAGSFGGNSNNFLGTAAIVSVGLFPSFVAVGDFNNDGKSDFVTTNGDSTVSVVLGGGNGIASTFGVGSGGAGSVTVSDFNGDGKSDLAITKPFSNQIAITLGSGNGSFAAPVFFAVGSNPSSVSAGDFNGDGTLDLAVTNYDSNNVSILLSTFSRAAIIINDTPPNRAPVNTIPAAQVVNEDTQLVITGISVNDPDNNLASTKLTIANGILNLDVTGGATISTGANNSSTITLTGTQSQINAALGTLKYKGNLNFNGTETLTISSTDSSSTPLTDTDTLILNINPINDAPTDISLSTTNFNENIPINTLLGTFVTTDPDNSSNFVYGFIMGSGDIDNSSFSINGNQLIINRSPDFETKSTYSVRVRSTDAGGQFFDKILVLNVNNLINNNVVGTVENDILSATNEIDNIQTLDGDDNIFAAIESLQFSDVFDGGNGNDTFSLSGGVSDQALTINLSLSNQFVSLDTPVINNVILKNIENIVLTGWVGNASLRGNAFNNILKGGVGNDTLNGGVGNDNLFGGDGNDILDGSGDTIGLDTFTGGAGNDAYGIYNSATVIIESAEAGAGNDTVWTSVNYTLSDNIENMYLVGAGAVIGTGNNGNNLIVGYGAGGNTIYSLGGNDTLDGGLDNDYLNGGLGNDVVNGGNGNDILDGSGDIVGFDTFTGGAGNDAYGIYNSATVIIESAEVGAGNDTVWTSVNYTLADNIENMYLVGVGAIIGAGNNGDNLIVGYGAGGNTIYGLGGNDTLDGGLDSDYLNGGLGNDIVSGGDGNDVLDGSGDSAGLDTFAGGAGDDTYGIYNSSTVIIENANEGNDTVWTGVNYTLAANIENLYLIGNATGIGSSGNNNIYGYGVGDNIIDGGDGIDNLFGGAGNDTFVLSKTSADNIGDFGVGNDRLQISASDFGGGLIANVALLSGQLRVGTTDVADTTVQRFIYNTINGNLFFDADGSAGSSSAIKIANLSSVSSLGVNSFLVV